MVALEIPLPQRSRGSNRAEWERGEIEGEEREGERRGGEVFLSMENKGKGNYYLFWGLKKKSLTAAYVE